jgi:two-component system OmpR family sensor kinase
LRKLILSLLLVVIVSIFGLGWGLDRLFERMGDKRDADDLTLLTELGATLAVALDDAEAPQRKLMDVERSGLISVDVLARDEFSLPRELSQQLEAGQPLVLESDSGVSIYYYLARSQQVLTITPEYLRESTHALSVSLIFTMVFYSGILVLTLIWLYPLVTRLLNLRRAAQRFGEGDLDERVPLRRFSYIRDIETEFNRMADRIQTLVSDNKLLAGAVSHDLRTPLARLRFGIETLFETQDASKRREYHERIDRDLDEMEGLVATLLSYARLDQSMQVLEKRSIDLGRLVSDVCDPFREQCPGLVWQPPNETVHVEGDEKRLNMLVNNLLQNACSYAQRQVRVSVALVNPQCCRLIVEDDGSGIALEQREEVLKPFVRGSDAQQGKGFGMGLAIVSRIAQWHGATFEIQDSDALGGARIQIDFTRLPAPS